MNAADLADLFLRFLALSLLSIGGGLTVAPEMHRFVVDERGWIDDTAFTASIALAQASPGPNVLFVTLVGWHAGGWAGALATTVGIMLPSTVLALAAHRFTERLREAPWVRAFRTGMAPITIGMLLATGWILASPNLQRPWLLALTGLTALLTLRTRLNPLWLIAAGAVAGALQPA